MLVIFANPFNTPQPVHVLARPSYALTMTGFQEVPDEGSAM